MPNKLEISPLTGSFGVIVHNLNLSDISRDKEFPQLRALFEERSALLIPGQNLSPGDHLRLAEMFGPIEDRKKDERKPGETVEVAMVSNVTDDGGDGAFKMRFDCDETVVAITNECSDLAAPVDLSLCHED